MRMFKVTLNGVTQRVLRIPASDAELQVLAEGELLTEIDAAEAAAIMEAARVAADESLP